MVVGTSLVEQVVGQINGLIESGTWALGERIPNEQQLGVSLGVGRSTVREAVRGLSHSGILEVRQGDGTRVRARDELAVLLGRRGVGVIRAHVLEVRAALETEAARLAALRRTDGQAEQLQHTLKRRETAWRAGDHEDWVEADLALHVAVVDAAHNPLLSRVYLGFVDELRASIAGSAAAGVESPQHLDHSALVEAIVEGDPAAAARAVSRLIHEVGVATGSQWD